MTKKLALLSLLAIPFLLARSDEPTPEGVGHWSASALGHVTQSLSADAASDPHHLAVKQLTDYPNESFLLVHREADGQPEWHETQADVFFVRIHASPGAWPKARARAVNGKFHGSFSDEPHLRMHVMMWWMRHAARRQRRFMHLQRFSSGELALQYIANLRAVRRSNRQLFEGIHRRGHCVFFRSGTRFLKDGRDQHYRKHRK